MKNLESKLNRELLKYAVMQQIFCPSCQDILDVRRAVLAQTETGSACLCGTCWDRVKAGPRLSKILAEESTSVIDGRDQA